MSLVRWDPMSEFRAMARRMEHMFEPGWAVRFAPPYAAEEGTWPPVDIYEDKEELVLRAEVPGMEQKDVEVRLEDSTLTLRGQRRLLHDDKKENYQRVECVHGDFCRTFSLPSTIDAQKVRASLNKGVLEIHLQKREGAKAKTVPITA